MTTSAALPAIAGGGFSIPPGVFGASVGAVKQLFITTALGAATVLSGAIEPASISALSKIVYNLFLPSFLFCSVIKTVTTYGVSPQLLLMPLFATLQISVGLLVSRFVVLPLLRINPKSDRGRELTLCTSFHNPGVLPLLFFDALFRAPYPDAAVMPQSITISTLAILKTWIEIVQQSKEAGISIAGKASQLWHIGAGLPLDALKKGAIVTWRCPYELGSEEIPPVLDALGKNSSLTHLDLSRSGISFGNPDASG